METNSGKHHKIHISFMKSCHAVFLVIEAIHNNVCAKLIELSE